jgi:hypothetical protein
MPRRRAAKERGPLAEKLLRVECYAGYKGDERPVRLQLGGEMVDVAEVEDRWYSPGATYFRVLLRNDERYVLRREDAQDLWTLEAFRSPAIR